MKLVLLSGGSGKRLWPLSNDTRSKQFLKVLDNHHNDSESMVQRVWQQLKNVDLIDTCIIATSKVQVDMIISQLGEEVTIVVEPERKDTFPAIALASAYYYSLGVGLDEVVCILPVDPFVEDQFFQKVKELESVVQNSEADIALIGIEPTYPSEKYGYIVSKPKHNKFEYSVVERFKEKPTLEEANNLLDEKALWNSGVFAFKLGYIISLLEEKGIPTIYEMLLHYYSRLTKISFDYEVIEKATNIVVLPYMGEWKDLGTWNTLTEEMSSTIIGKGIMGNDCLNTHVINELDIPVVVDGLKDLVIVASPDGILVIDKQASTKMKELITDMDQRPMYEEKRWGWYKVLDYSFFSEEQEVLTKRLCIYPNKNLSYQMHLKRSEVWTIISGDGMFVMDGDMNHVKKGDVLHIPMGAKHALRANSEMELIVVQMGIELIEEDVARFGVHWHEIEEYCSKTRKTKTHERRKRVHL